MTRALRVFFLIGDFVFLNVSVLLSVYLVQTNDSLPTQSQQAYLFIFSNLSWFFLVLVSTPYNITKGWSVSRVMKGQFAFVFVHLLVVAALVFFFRQSYSPLQLFVIYATFVPLFFTSRVAAFYLRKVVTAEPAAKHFVLIGRNYLSADIRKYYLMNPQEGMRFKGYLDFADNDTSLDEIRKFSLQEDIHEIYICLPKVNQEALHELVRFGLDSLIKIRIVSATRDNAIQLDQFDRAPGVDLATIKLDESFSQFIKRVFDVVFAATFCLLVLSWLVPIVGLLIKLDSRGPIFFRQLRSGLKNQPFGCLKFRTMIVNQQSDTMQASKNDPRITKLGHFLRKTSIDELPQFLNVLVGSMSIVGPRPHMLRHTEEYSKLIDRFMGRHYVKPGITGLAQCLGYRGETKDLIDMENRVRMDRYYIENWTFWLDIKIIFLTVISLVRGSDKAF
jgi:putative colanic acid biosynthesis UDP-glucose lipid carrier transferase